MGRLKERGVGKPSQERRQDVSGSFPTQADLPGILMEETARWAKACFFRRPDALGGAHGRNYEAGGTAATELAEREACFHCERAECWSVRWARLTNFPPSLHGRSYISTRVSTSSSPTYLNCLRQARWGIR